MLSQELQPQEQEELKIGQEIYEMTQTAGFQHIKTWLEDMSFHSWVDPRSVENSPDSEKEWKWRELNAFYAANNARELLERIQKAISQSEYYEKIKSGELKRRPMRIE